MKWNKLLPMMGVLIAIEIVLSRFLSINAWNLRIGFSFVPIAIAGMLLGPLPAGIVAAVADVLGAILFPTGPFFPGFTLTAFLTGVIWGIFLYRKQTPLRILFAVLINQLILSFLLNSLWISVLYGSPFMPLLATRIIQTAILIPVQFIVIGALMKTLGVRIRKVEI
ncbi:MAG: folate family ECF transporter S component [Lachnospiraceae bacterium]|nr:folate family ECF transporter S component [Lachnospiraceae bacterium]